MRKNKKNLSCMSAENGYAQHPLTLNSIDFIYVLHLAKNSFGQECAF